MRKHAQLFMSVLAASTLLFSCTKEKSGPDIDDDDPQEEEIDMTPSILMNTEETTFTFDAKSEGISFNVLANYDWILTKTDLDWADVTPASGEADELVAVTVTPLNNPDQRQRQGSFMIAIPGKDCSKEFTVIQEAKGEAKPVVIAKWQFTALWVNEESSAPTNKTNPNATGAAMATAWQNGNPVASTVVEGGYLSFVSTSSTAVLSMGPATHKKDRFRATNLNKDDYFLFTIDHVEAETGDTIRFRNAFLQTANINKGPGQFAMEWSVDRTSWTKIRDVTLNSTSANTPESLNFDLTVPSPVNGTFYTRIRISSDMAADGTTVLAEGAKMLPMLTVDDARYPSANTYDVRDSYYEEDWAFVYFEMKKE